MVVLDSTIVDVSLAKVMATFGVGIDTVKWIATAYLLAFAILLPTSGWIADHFGYKKTYGLGLAMMSALPRRVACSTDPPSACCEKYASPRITF